VKVVLGAAAVLASVAVFVGQATASGSSGPIAVRLPKHVFGHFRSPDARMVDARWGEGPGQVGFVKAEYGPTGGSSFDVVQGVVCILDQHNGRILAFEPGNRTRTFPLVVPGLAGKIFRGVESSLAVGTDGTIYVLEPVDSIHHTPTLRSFPARGGAALATRSTQSNITLVRTAGNAAFTSPSVVDPWKQAMKAGRVAPGAWRNSRPFADGSSVRVHPLRKPDNKPQPWVVSMTTTSGKQLTWSVSSPNDIQVEDAESFGGIELMLVLNVYTDTRNEYEAVVLGPRGLVDSFSIPGDRYADTAPNDDFRVDGSTLYHRGSTKKGVYVDYYSF